MKEMLRMRVFERKGAIYYLADKDVPLELVIRNQMEVGYYPMDFISFGVDFLRVVFSYNPAAVEKFRQQSENVMDLVNMKSEEGV